MSLLEHAVSMITYLFGKVSSWLLANSVVPSEGKRGKFDKNTPFPKKKTYCLSYQFVPL